MKQTAHNFNETEINFFINNIDKDVLANASEMGRVFKVKINRKIYPNTYIIFKHT